MTQSQGKFILIVSAISISLLIHIGMINLWSPPNPIDFPQTQNQETTPRALETAALQAFEVLDNERQFNEAMDEVLNNIPKVDFSDTIKPKPPEPKPVPKAKPKAKAPKPNANPAPEPVNAQKSPQKSANPAPSAPKATPPVNNPQAEADFGRQVKAAILQSISLPRNLPRQARGARAIINISFKNGQVAGFGLAQSSGFAEIDSAIINGVKRARFAPAPANVSYNIPININ